MHYLTLTNRVYVRLVVGENSNSNSNQLVHVYTSYCTNFTERLIRVIICRQPDLTLSAECITTSYSPYFSKAQRCAQILQFNRSSEI